jgi:hypothetical protein
MTGVLLCGMHASSAIAAVGTSKTNVAVTSAAKQQNNFYYPIMLDNNHIGFMDKNGKITKTPYDFAYLFDGTLEFTEGLFPFRDAKGNQGFMDHTGRVVVKPQYNILGELSDGMIMFRTMTNGKMLSGYMNKAGKIIVKPQFMYAQPFSEGLAKVYVSENNYGYINKSGQWVIKPTLKSASVMDGVGTFTEGMSSFRVPSDPNNLYNSTWSWGFLDAKGNVAVKPTYSFAWKYSEGLAKVEEGGKSGFIDKNGNMVIKPAFQYAQNFSEGLASVTEEGKTGYIDKTGKVVIPLQFTSVSDFKEGVASGRLDGKVCLFDKTGKIILKSDYSEIKGSNGGLCVVNKNGLYGVINKAGKVVIKPQYRYINDYKNGMAFALDNKGCGYYINAAGKVIWKSKKSVIQNGGQG